MRAAVLILAVVLAAIMAIGIVDSYKDESGETGPNPLAPGQQAKEPGALKPGNCDGCGGAPGQLPEGNPGQAKKPDVDPI